MYIFPIKIKSARTAYNTDEKIANNSPIYFPHCHVSWSYRRLLFSASFLDQNPVEPHKATADTETNTHFPRHDLLVDLYWLVSEERRVSGGHFIDENAQCPPVNRLVVALQHTNTHKLCERTPRA